MDYPPRHGITAVEGGRWSESVAAAKGALSSLFKPTRRNGRDRYSRTGTSRSSGGSFTRNRAAPAGRYRGNLPNHHNQQGRPPYNGNPGMGYGGQQDNSKMRPGGRQSWVSEPVNAPEGVPVQGVNDCGSRNGIGQGMGSPAGPWETPQPIASTTAGGQYSGRGIDREQNVELGTGGSMYPPPRPPPPPSGNPWGGDDVSRVGGGHGITTDVNEGMPIPPQEQPSLGNVSPPPAESFPDRGFPHAPQGVTENGASTSGLGAEEVGRGLDPKEVEEFYAKQKQDYDGDGIVDGMGHGEIGKGGFLRLGEGVLRRDFDHFDLV